MTILAAVAVALIIRILILEAFKIPTTSMRPTLVPGDNIFVAKWRYLPFFQPPFPRRNQLVLYQSQKFQNKNLIKRVIGLPGEEIEIKRGSLFINKVEVRRKLEESLGVLCGQESFIDGSAHGLCTEQGYSENFGPENTPGDHVFVIGDFRETKKNKSWEIIPLSSIRGEALWIWLSLGPPSRKDSADGSWFYVWNWVPQLRFERMFKRIQ